MLLSWCQMLSVHLSRCVARVQWLHCPAAVSKTTVTADSVNTSATASCSPDSATSLSADSRRLWADRHCHTGQLCSHWSRRTQLSRITLSALSGDQNSSLSTSKRPRRQAGRVDSERLRLKGAQTSQRRKRNVRVNRRYSALVGLSSH